MKYFKVYHNNVRVPKAFLKLDEIEFDAELNNFAFENASSHEDENGNIDFDALAAETCNIANDVYEQAQSEDGFDYGDYHLYVRDDDADVYDIAREAR